jgi:electron transfer flavoprotein beta subunit
MIAEAMDLPFVSLATKLDMNGSTATLEREVTGGVQVVQVDLPFVASCA